ncbi:ubiquitin-like protein 4A-A [Acipenser ruthenus]|uniref:ubiquitin-like protein 4A-A n=1 Tax=Acipenser ruthenus TaxID=7906 RepID=UPI00274238E1|nr:ubiquitin-like protein 4A-A [Acipenser ruthenus]
MLIPSLCMFLSLDRSVRMRRSPQSGVWSLTGSTYLSINRDSSTKARRWQVCEDEKVSTVWSLVSDRLNIPVNQQGLLYKGKALAGRLNSTAQRITAQNSSPLLSRLASPRVSVAQPACSSEQTLQPCRRSESLEQQHKDYERRLRLLSLVDMERLATRMLHPEAVECMELSFLD